MFQYLPAGVVEVLDELLMKKFSVASHSFGSGTTAWTLSESENQATVLVCTAAGGAADIVATPTAGKVFLVRNGSGAALTIKASGQTGVAVANGVSNWVVGTGTDFAAAGLSAASAASTTAAGIVELATTAEVLTGTSTSLAVVPTAIGKKRARVYKTDDATLTAAEMNGTTIVVNAGAAKTLTLPTVAAGLNAQIVSAAAYAVHVKAGASDKITLHGTALDDGDKVSSHGDAGNMIEIMANAAGTDWETGLFSGAWTDGGA